MSEPFQSGERLRTAKLNRVFNAPIEMDRVVGLVGALAGKADASSVPDATAINVTAFGAVAGTETDQTAAFNAALTARGAAGGGVVTVPWGASNGYRIDGRLDIPANVTLMAASGPDGARTVLRMSAAEAVRMDFANAGFVGFRIIANHSTSAYQVRLGLNAHRCTVDVEFDNGNSGVVTRANDGRLTVFGREMRGSVVRISGGQRNYVAARGRNVTGFVVFVTHADEAPPVIGASYNYGPHVESWVEPALFTAWQLANRPETATGKLGIEALGVRHSCRHNYWPLVIRRGSYDAGCTLSGQNNRVDLMIGEDCDLPAMSLPGENNTVGAVYATRCLAATNSNANAGGIAANNTVGAVVAIDCVEAGSTVKGGLYALWVSGLERASVGYCHFSGRLYERISGDTTPFVFGTIAPVHTSGDVSDGNHVWRFVRAIPDGFVARGNAVERVIAEGTTPVAIGESGGAILSVGNGKSWALGTETSRLYDRLENTIRWDRVTNVSPAFDFRRAKEGLTDAGTSADAEGEEGEVEGGTVLGQLRWWGWRSGNYRIAMRAQVLVDSVPVTPTNTLRAQFRINVQRDDGTNWTAFALRSTGRAALRRDPGSSASMHTPVAALDVNDEVVAEGFSYRTWAAVSDAPSGVLNVGYSGSITLTPSGALSVTEINGTFVRFSRLVIRNQTSNIVTFTHDSNRLRLGGSNITLGQHDSIELVAITPTASPQIWMLVGGNFQRPAGPIFPGPYADDAAAATGGVQIGGAYRVTGGNVAWRQV